MRVRPCAVCVGPKNSFNFRAIGITYGRSKKQNGRKVFQCRRCRRVVWSGTVYIYDLGYLIHAPGDSFTKGRFLRGFTKNLISVFHF